MSTKISGKEYQISQIFSSAFDFHIPSYPRPYAWGTEEASTLFEDLYGFYKSERSEENYFLGSTVLIKEEDRPKADVIDGQQRLTTLTILHSVLTTHFSQAEILSDYQSYLREPGRPSQGLAASPRLHLREKDQPFFEKYIQEFQLSDLLALDKASLTTESQKHILESAEIFEKKIHELEESKNGKTKTCVIHRLVAETYLPNPLNLPQVNHKDEDKLNNALSNLEYCTAAYNTNYGTHNERSAKARQKKVICIETGQVFKSVKEAQDFVNSTHISECCRGKLKTTAGYHWAYYYEDEE